MKILAPPTPRRHHAPDAPAERPRAVAPARLGCAPGTSRDVLDKLNEAAAREELRQRPAQRPFPALMAAIGATHAACLLADAILDDISDLADAWIDALEPLMASGIDHATRMLLLPVAAQFAEQLPAAHSTWDHRPLNVAVGRELPAEETAMPRQWFDEPTPEQQAAAAQRDATRASWRGLGLADGTPPPIGMDPFHEPGNPACGCTQCSIAAAVAAKAEPVAVSPDGEPWPFLYSPAQLDGTACARCGKEFAVNEPSHPVVTDECNEQFVHTDCAQCGPAVPPWNDADDAGTEATAR